MAGEKAVYYEPVMAQAFRDCEEITFNAESAEAAEKKCPRIFQRALRALRSNVAFLHRLVKPANAGLKPRPHM